MVDNYYKIIDFIENCPDKIDINDKQLNQLIRQTSAYNKTEIVVYCTVKLRKITRQLTLTRYQSLALGVLLAIVLYISLNEYFVNDFWNAILIFDAIVIGFLIKPNNYLLPKKVSKYKRFRAKFAAS